MKDILYRCPKCQTPGFSAAGLHRHQCRAKPEKARLTLLEISQARPVGEGEPVQPKGNGGVS